LGGRLAKGKKLSVVTIPKSNKSKARAVTQVLLAAVLLIAAIAKATEIDDLIRTLNASQLVPLWSSGIAPYIVISVELAIAALLLMPGTSANYGARASMLLFCFFAGYQIWRAFQGIPVLCQCFGPLLRLESWSGAGLAAGLALVSGFLAIPSPSTIRQGAI
jgi:hypothetical protein